MSNRRSRFSRAPLTRTAGLPALLLLISFLSVAAASDDPVSGTPTPLPNSSESPTPSPSATPVDIDPPVVSVLSPRDGAIVNGVVTVSLTVSDNDAVVSVELLVNDAVVLSRDSAPWGFSWDASKTAGGVAKLKVRAKDRSGNTADSDPVTVTVASGQDTEAPTVDMREPFNSSLLKGAFTVGAEAHDNVAVTGVRFYLGNQFVDPASLAPADSSFGPFFGSRYIGAGQAVGPIAFQFSWDSRREASGAAVPDGDVFIFAVAEDAAGNRTMSFGDKITLDNTPPTLHVTSPTNGQVVSGVVAIKGSASDLHLKSVWIYADTRLVAGGADGFPADATWNSASVPNGNHVIEVIAEDTAGNQTAVSISVVVTNVNNGSIHVEIADPLENSAVSGVVPVRFFVEGTPPASIEFIVDGQALKTWTPASAPQVDGPDHADRWFAGSPPGVFAWASGETGSLGGLRWANGPHEIRIRAKAFNGDIGEDIAPVSTRNSADTAAPSARLWIGSSAGEIDWNGRRLVSGPLQFQILSDDTSAWVKNLMIVSPSQTRAFVDALTHAPAGGQIDSFQLGDGEHEIVGTVFDGAGNESVARQPILVLNEPMSSIHLSRPFAGESITADPTKILYDLSNPPEVVRTEIYVDLALVATGDRTGAAWNPGSLAPGEHLMEARAFDQYGRHTSDTIRFTLLPPDRTPPTVQILNISNGDELCGRPPVVVVARDDRFVSSIELWAGNVRIGSIPQPSGTFILDTPSLPPEIQTLRAVAIDPAGNRGETSVNVMLRRSCVYTGEIGLELRVPAPQAVGRVVIAARHISGPVPDRVDLFIDFQRVASWSGAGGVYAAQWDSTSVGDGLHDVRVYGWTADGKTGWDMNYVFVNNPGGGTQPLGAPSAPSSADQYFVPSLFPATPAQIAAIDWSKAAACSFFVTADANSLIGVRIPEGGEAESRTLTAPAAVPVGLASALKTFEVSPVDAAGIVPFHIPLSALGLTGPLAAGDLSLTDVAGSPVALSMTAGGLAVSGLLPGPGVYAFRDSRAASGRGIVPLAVHVGASPSPRPIIRVEASSEITVQVFNAAGERTAVLRQSPGAIEGGTGAVFALDLPSDAYFLRISDADNHKTTAKALVVR